MFKLLIRVRIFGVYLPLIQPLGSASAAVIMRDRQLRAFWRDAQERLRYLGTSSTIPGRLQSGMRP